MSKDNIVLLPTIAAELELEIASYMQKKDFEAALDKLNLLRTYEHNSYNVYRDTLTCLIKLCYTEEAFQLCEELLSNRTSGHYYDYLEFYIILLYETENYVELIETVEREKFKMPEINAQRINDFKGLAIQMRAWQSEELLTELKQSVTEKTARKQYQLLIKWRNEKFSVIDYFEDLISRKDIHPVVKTQLFTILKENNWSEQIRVEKFNQRLSISPSAVCPLERQPGYLLALNNIEETQQHNPILYSHTKELIDAHAYILYPFTYKKEKAADVSKAALAIAKANLGLEETVMNDEQAKEILVYQKLYQQIILQ